MLSPFPGMDPYMENVIYWRSVHASIISTMTFALNDALPEAFVARMEGRSYILPNHDLIYPDAILVRSPSADEPVPRGGVATAISTATVPLVFEYTTETVEESFINILSVDDEEIIAVIEVLSPANKAPESTGREEYLRKQQDVLRSTAHLLEIDLLRGGAHTVAVSRGAVSARTPFDYMVSLRRANAETPRKSRFEVYPFTVREAMPTIRVPLLPGFSDVPLPLQKVWETTYRGGRWNRVLNYRTEPDPILSAADTTWADARLRESGLRA